MPIKHTCIVGDNQKTAEMMLSMGRADRLHCLECVGFSAYEVRNCSHTICAMWPFRFGKDPGRVKRDLSEEQKTAMVERFKRNISGPINFDTSGGTEDDLEFEDEIE